MPCEFSNSGRRFSHLLVSIWRKLVHFLELVFRDSFHRDVPLFVYFNVGCSIKRRDVLAVLLIDSLSSRNFGPYTAYFELILQEISFLILCKHKVIIIEPYIILDLLMGY